VRRQYSDRSDGAAAQARQALYHQCRGGRPARDGDSRAAFALFDREAQTVTFRRVIYNIRRTQPSCSTTGLPEILAARLSFGL
jgi:hypothetical protein